MKNLDIQKIIWTSGDISWYVEIKENEESKRIGSSFKRNVFAKKVADYMNGTTDEIKHNGRKYTVSGSKFTASNKKVYIISDEETDKPVLFYYLFGKVGWTVYDFVFADEDIEFFEKYGYAVEDKR